MTSVVSDQGRGSKERMAPQTTHTTQPQKQRQATAEQIRLAQIIDKSDADFEGKIKQLVEVTGRTQDECVVALHDCNEDVNRAINFLLEGATDKSSWETVGKKRSVGKEGPSADAKDTREKRGEREAGRGRGGPSRRGRGTSRTVDARLEENGFDAVPGDRGVERGRRGRGKGPMGRGRGPVGSRFPPQGMGTFNPADYANSATAEPGEDASGTNGSGPWQNHLEDWASEDWSEDLSETKVFTASFTNKSHVPYEHGAGLVPLLPKAVAVGGDVEPPALQTLGQSLVFTNSQQPLQAGGRAANSYAAAAAAGTSSAFVSTPKPVQSDLPRPESLAGPRPPLAPTRPAVAGGDASPAGEPAGPTPEAQPVTVPTNEAKAESPEPSPELVLKSDPEPSAILGQLLLQQQQPPLPAQSDLQGLTSEPPLPPRDTPSPAKPVACEPPTPDAAQQRQTRPQRRRAPPPSKIPSSAVEMPGAADVSGLNVQFGALDFGTEAGLTDQEPGPAPTGPTPHLSKPITASESLGGLPPCLPPAAADPTYPLPSLGLPAASAPPGPRTDPPPPRGPSAPDAAPAPLSNGFGDVRTTGPQDGILKLEATVLPSESVASCPSSTNTPTPSLSSHVSSSHVVGTVGTASPSLTVSVSSPSVSNGLPSAAPSTIRSAPPPSSSSGKPPPNLPQGVPPLLPNQYIMGPGGLLPAYPQIYGYEELQMIQSRLPMDYYGMTFPATTLAGRDGGLASNPYSGEATKFGRADSSSPAPPPTSLSAVPPPSQTQPPAGAGPPPPSAGAAAGSPSGPGQGPAFLGAALPAGYGYTGVPYYASLPAVPAVPSAFQYGPAVFVPPGSGKQHALGLANPSSQYQPPAGYGQHAYGAGFDDVNGDYGKGGYGGGAQSQTKPAGSSTVKAPGLSGSVGSGGVPDLNASVYSKSQSFDKQGFPAATPQAFSLPSALGGTGAPYGHAPFLHILPAHQQPHSQLLHHHLAQDTQAMPGQRSQSSSMQKSQVSKSSYGSAPYWPN